MSAVCRGRTRLVASISHNAHHWVTCHPADDPVEHRSNLATVNGLAAESR
ncbi:hypothetical protein [Streptomyces sp. NPDC098926]